MNFLRVHGQAPQLVAYDTRLAATANAPGIPLMEGFAPLSPRPAREPKAKPRPPGPLQLTTQRPVG